MHFVSQDLLYFILQTHSPSYIVLVPAPGPSGTNLATASSSSSIATNVAVYNRSDDPADENNIPDRPVTPEATLESEHWSPDYKVYMLQYSTWGERQLDNIKF